MCSSSSSHADVGRLLLCSKTWGVNTDHEQLQYYQKTFDQDYVRVRGLFEQVQQQQQQHHGGLQVAHISHLGLSQVIRLVSLNHIVAILLLDISILSFRKKKKKQYAGHYVVLCGMSCEPKHLQQAQQLYNEVSNSKYCFVIQNPASPCQEASYITPTLLEKAWRSQGTDDDIIFVSKRIIQ